jgi:hypothetical protein
MELAPIAIRVAIGKAVELNAIEEVDRATDQKQKRG